MTGPASPAAAPPRPWDRPIAFHCVLAPLPQIVAFAAQNAYLTSPIDVLPLALLASGATTLLWLLLSQIGGNARTAAFGVSLLAMATTANVSPTLIVPFWLGVFVVVVVSPFARDGLQAVTTFANAAFLVAITWSLGSYAMTRASADGPTVRAGRFDGWVAEVTPPAAAPDVWMFVVDGYGHPDVLRDAYGVTDDLTPFLESRGFCVPDGARSNYSQTLLSLASTMNLDYLPSLLDGLPSPSMWRDAPSALIRNSRLSVAFQRAGYRTVAWKSEYGPLEQTDADELRGLRYVPQETEYAYLVGTNLPELSEGLGWMHSEVSRRLRRRTLRATLDDLRAGDRWDEPVFAFAHLLVPHPPFLFEPDGSLRKSRLSAAFHDGTEWHAAAEGSGETYAEGYRDQVVWLNSELRAVIDGILATSATPPVIVIHGDHGPGGHYDGASVANTNVDERMSVLSAWRVPGGACTDFPAGTTTVNGWRAVLRRLLGAPLPPLEDRSFGSTWEHPYLFQDVTDRLTPPPSP